ncbi:hypothetical protein [Occallatibacter savannae]|uniref:hypothetical protein n=1 Tax=Occallatibacter savannae TaxID=1002691 RepID=UPI000D69CF95|nr:hypothetical protein [Occallatibacter savannae]
MPDFTEKEVMFIYNGDPESAEIDQDPKGEVPIPEDGSTVLRKGKQWTVTHSQMEATAIPSAVVPVLRIDLSDRER